MTPAQEGAAILNRYFAAIARAAGKRWNATNRADIERACELIASTGDDLDALLEDIPTMPRMRPASEADTDEGFEMARRRREERERAGRERS